MSGVRNRRRGTLWAAQAFAAAALSLWAAMAAPGQTVEPVPPASLTGAMILPDGSKGASRSRVQLVWNDATRTLERRRYEFFDPLAEIGLDVFWEPRFPALDKAGPIDGEGVLTWREPGSIRHGRDTIVAQYRGRMTAGRPDGRGVLVHRSRLRYDGGWSKGAANGDGHLLLPNGDVYSGGFRAGRIHGRGRYITAAGDVYEGGHTAGLRDGDGLVSQANRFTYASFWRAGIEDVSRRGPAPRGWPDGSLAQAEADAPPDLSVSVSLGGQASFCCHFGPPAISYTSISHPDRLEIYPDAPDMLDVWRGKANIVIDDAAYFDWDRYGVEQYSFLNYSTMHVQPVTLLLGLENRGTEDVRIVGAFIDVTKSRVDMEPALQSLELLPLNRQNIEFSIENYGWGPADDATLRFRFRNLEKDLESEPMEIAVGEVSSVHHFSFAGPIEQMGARMAELPGLEMACWAGDGPACLEDLLADGALGGLTEFVQVQGQEFGVEVDGTLAYRWLDADGRQQSDDAPFRAWVPLGGFGSGAECEGADFSTVSAKPFSFEERDGTYRIPLPISGNVAAGAVNRWKAMTKAPKSSKHTFAIVFQLADGRYIRSRQMEMLYFQPRNFPESVRPFQPRC